MKTSEKTKIKNEQNKKEILKTVIILGIIFGATFGGYYIFKAAMGSDIPIVVVTSNSMEDTIFKGDLLFVKYVEPENIKNGTAEDLDGDIIIYESQGVWTTEPAADAPVVHRVINKWEEDGEWYFHTQGDNRVTNPYPDPPSSPHLDPIPGDKIYGVVVGQVRYIGWIKIWLSSSGMAIPLMVILAVLLVISIAYDITHPEEEDEAKQAVEDGKNVDVEKFKEEEFDFGV